MIIEGGLGKFSFYSTFISSKYLHGLIESDSDAELNHRQFFPEKKNNPCENVVHKLRICEFIQCDDLGNRQWLLKLCFNVFLAK